MARTKNTPNDPERRERLVAATMDILQADGITGVTARGIAARAGVPVGSVSYHFASVREAVLEASHRVAALRIGSLRAWTQTVTKTTLTQKLAELIYEQLTTGRALTVVAYELYVLGLRDEEFRTISATISAALRDAIAAHLAPVAAARLAASADGLQLVWLMSPQPPSTEYLHRVLTESDADEASARYP